MLKVTKAKRIQSLQRITRIKLKRWHVFDWMRKNVCFKCRSRKHSGYCYGFTPDNDDSEEEIPICTDCGISQDECMCHYGEYERDHECTWCHGEREGGCMYCGDWSDDGRSDYSGDYDVPPHTPSYVVMTPRDHELVKSGKYPTCHHCSRSLLGQVVIAQKFCSKQCYLDEQKLLEED